MFRDEVLQIILHSEHYVSFYVLQNDIIVVGFCFAFILVLLYNINRQKK